MMARKARVAKIYFRAFQTQLGPHQNSFCSGFGVKGFLFRIEWTIAWVPEWINDNNRKLHKTVLWQPTRGLWHLRIRWKTINHVRLHAGVSKFEWLFYLTTQGSCAWHHTGRGASKVGKRQTQYINWYTRRLLRVARCEKFGEPCDQECNRFLWMGPTLLST